MSDITDFENASTEITQDVMEAAGVAAVVTDEVPVGAIVVALTIIIEELLKGTDEIQDAVQALVGHFDAILSAEDQVLHMRDVAKLVNEARAQLDPIRALSPGQSLSESQRATMDSTTDEVVRTLGDISYWKRPFFLELVYDDAFSGLLLPEPSLGPGSLVFEYRLTLPAYLEAIAIRLIVLLALDGEIKATRQSEIASIVTQLEEYYNKIRAGIVTIRPPTYLEIKPPPIGGPLAPTAWDTGDPFHHVSRPYGAVERYSTSAVVDSWPSDSIPIRGQSPPLPDSFEFRDFSARLALGSLSRSKKVYSAVGLPAVWRILIHLKALAGVPVPHTVDTGSVLSLREVDNVLATAILNRPSTGSQNAPISVRKLISMLGYSPPVFGYLRPVFWGW
jgi:hypothetical protein